MKKKHVLFLAAGGFILSLSFIADHYLTLPDFLSGLFKGVALGLMLLAVRFSLHTRPKERSVAG